MALAKGTSRIRCNLPLTLHTKTAIYIAELMTNVSQDSTVVFEKIVQLTLFLFFR